MAVMRTRHVIFWSLVGALLAATIARPEPVAAASGDELLIVDCLLPGKVRRLGRRVTFVTARRAVRTTASDCEIRGGEYTAHDRANYATSLKIWLPLAKDGDPAAAHHVGEIHEKGLGVEPQYELAAAWYLKAAKKGHAQAQISLGALYEKGLGVPRDKVKAVEWYRRASGLSEAGIAYVPSDVKAELEELRSERDTLLRERDALRLELDAVRSELDRARELYRAQHRRTSATLSELETAKARLERQRRSAKRAGDDAEARRLERALEAKAADAEKKRRELARMRERVVALNGKATRLASALNRAKSQSRDESARHQASSRSAEEELAGLTARLQAARDELAKLGNAEEKQRRDAARIRARLAEEQAFGQRDEAKIRKLEARLEKKEQALATRDERLAELDGEVASLRRETRALKAKPASAPPPPAKVASASTGPVIEIIDPPLARTLGGEGGNVAIKATESRLVIGRVRSAGGLIAFMVNDEERKPGPDGLFKVKVPVVHPETPVRIVAIDGAGVRASLSFVLRPDAAAKGPARAPKALMRIGDIPFGEFHALVIGNNDYAHLPDLETAVNDARAVAELLRKRYGFKVKVLENANRYAILSSLNELREDLGDETNLLIYYAGHGELDRVNDRGHWLPVDAEPNSTANWISNIQITDVLNAMVVRQVMVVADSCYSGTLTRGALAQLDAAMSEQARYKWIKVMAAKRARVVLSSGGVQPVLDSGGDGSHSVFASAFLTVLRGSSDIIEGQHVYRAVAERLADSSAMGIDQVPRYAPIKFAGHEAGDFFFVPGAD